MVKKLLNFIFIIVIIAIIAVAGYLIYDWHEVKEINEDAKAFLEEVKQEELSTNSEPIVENTTEEKQFSKLYKGYEVSGEIEIPNINLDYPILSEMKNSRALEISVCIQYFSKRSRFK